MSARIIETPRIRLRGWRDEDVEPWYRMNTDPDVMEFFPFPYSRERAHETAQWMREELERDGYGWWILEIKDVAPFAGTIALVEIPYETAFTPATEIGWRLFPEHWGKGYATEGAREALRVAFDELQRDEVVAMTAVQNARSRRVMERLGMTRNPEDDFEHPRIEPGHPLRKHVLYRIGRANFRREES